MIRILTAVIVAALFMCPIHAEEIYAIQTEQYGVDNLIEEVPEGLQMHIDATGNGLSVNWTEGMKNLLTQSLESSMGYVQQAIAASAKILLILVFCKLPEVFDNQTYAVPTIMTGALGIFVCCVNDMKTMLGLGRSVMEQMVNFSSVLLPTLSAAAVGAGSITGAGITYAAAVFVSHVLMRIGNSFIIPGIYAYLALGLADSILQQDRLKRAREFLGWIMKLLLKGIVYLYIGFLSVSGILTGAGDSAALKAAKLTISGMVPIVGGIVSNAAESILTGAGVLKNAVGTIGLLAIFSMFALPVLRMGISYVMLRGVSALGGILESKHCGLLDSLSSAMAFLLALIGSFAIVNILSCFSFLKMVHV